MRIAFEVFRRGRSLTIREQSWDTDRFVYFQYGKLRNGTLVRNFTIQDRFDGGLEVRVLRDGKSQGWFLRGPVGHFESL